MAPTKRAAFGQSDDQIRKKVCSVMARLRDRIPPVPDSWGPVESQHPHFKEEPDDVLKVAYLKKACGPDGEPPDTSRSLSEDLLGAMRWAEGKTAEEIMATREATMRVASHLIDAGVCFSIPPFCNLLRPSKSAARL